MEDFKFENIKDFGALADAAAADRMSSQRVLSTPYDSPGMHAGSAQPQEQAQTETQTQTQTQTGSMTQSMSQSRTPSSAAPNPGEEDQEEEEEEEGEDETEEPDAPPPAPIGSDITAWTTAIQTLPAEFKNQPRPQHPLAVLLSEQKTIRQIEWNPNRQNGGFVPRTPNDFSSMMIFICGQINPNPCRNCRLKNGPYAMCVVAPPEILAVSTIRHACANCCYQNQHRRCTNEPISHDEMIRSQVGRAGGLRNGAPKVRKPKSHAPKPRPATGYAIAPHFGIQYQYGPSQPSQRPPAYAGGTQASVPAYQYQPLPLPNLGKPSSDSGSVKSFADKVRMARAWNSQSRRRMKAELLQWQAALATADAERPRKTARAPVVQQPQQQQQRQQPQQQQQQQRLPPPQTPQYAQHQNMARPPPPATPNYTNHTMAASARPQATPSTSYPQSGPPSSYPQSTPSSSYPQYSSGLTNGTTAAPAFQPTGDIHMGDQDDVSDVTDTDEDDEGGGGEDHTWAGFDDEADQVTIKPDVP
ncbi:hypothetical protein PG996_008011 [Apiospora saccharicola]|uniref:Copper-fist domain-containing protein n=1 Tax=Apiospora saccharicola TaxID=335842 RepID=A0ABR1UWP9_9PEZI